MSGVSVIDRLIREVQEQIEKGTAEAVRHLSRKYLN